MLGDCKLTQTNLYYIHEIYLTKLNKIVLTPSGLAVYRFTRFSKVLPPTDLPQAPVV